MVYILDQRWEFWPRRKQVSSAREDGESVCQEHSELHGPVTGIFCVPGSLL